MVVFRAICDSLHGVSWITQPAFHLQAHWYPPHNQTGTKKCIFERVKIGNYDNNDAISYRKTLFPFSWIILSHSRTFWTSLSLYFREDFPLMSFFVVRCLLICYWSWASTLLGFRFHCPCWNCYCEVSYRWPLSHCVLEMGITINELYLVLERVTSVIVIVYWNGVDSGLRESYIPAVFFDSLV